jgi:hypothetical protein
MISGPELGISFCKEHGDIMIIDDYTIPGTSTSICKNGYEIQQTPTEIRLIKYHDSESYRKKYNIFYNKLSFGGYYYATPIKIRTIPISKEVLTVSIENFDEVKEKIEALSIFS